MQRRTALKNLLLFAGGTMLLPSCLHEDKKASIPLDKINLSQEDEQLLAEIAETLIPKTNTPGAKELGVHQFVATMIDDCYDKETQDKFMSGLKQINQLSKKECKKSFIESSPTEREKLLTKIEKKELGEEVLPFYNEMKSLTIQGYVKSKYVMSNLLVYELVPGRFHGSFPIKNVTRFQQHG